MRRLYRIDKDKVIAGVFSGLGHYIDLDPVILRLLWVALTVFTGFMPGLIAYLLAVVIIPKKTD